MEKHYHESINYAIQTLIKKMGTDVDIAIYPYDIIKRDYKSAFSRSVSH